MTTSFSKKTSLTALLISLLVLSGLSPLWAKSSLVHTKTNPPSQSFDLNLKDLGHTKEETFTLKTVKSHRIYHFTRPKNWKVQSGSIIRVAFQHAPALLPERSHLNVLVNHRILKSISLDKHNRTASTATIPLPADLLKDHNTLEFQVDQHYTYQCEDPFSSELWTTLLPETGIHLAYTPLAVKPDLANFPTPFFDPLNHGKTTLGYLAPEKNVSDESLEALAVVSALMGQHVAWRELRPFLAHRDGLKTHAPLILIGTPQENPMIHQLASTLPKGFPVSFKNNRFTSPNSNTPLSDTDGVLQVLPNPYHPDKAILIVSGNTPQGVLKAARLLAQQPSNQLLIGRYAIIHEQNPNPIQPFRGWEGYLQQLGETSLEKLGLKTQTSRGITALPLFYTVRKMPDLWTPSDQQIRMKTIYSYSSQLDPTQSKLEILLNGKPLANVPLDQHAGENQAEFSFDIPATEFFTYNDLEYKFHLFPEKFDACHFVTDAHLWGTLHNTSSFDVPGQIKAPLPDVGLLNDGGFPFTLYQDLSQIAIIMPKSLKATDLDALLNVTARLGRASKTQTGINLSVSRPDSLNEADKTGRHLIVIGSTKRNSLLQEFKSKTKLLIQNKTISAQNTPGSPLDTLATLHYTPEQGMIEEILSPWNPKKMALLITGETAEALKRTSQLFARDSWFNQIKPGNLMVINQNGPKSLTFLEKGDARFIRPEDYSPGPKIPSWIWVILGIFTFFGFLSVLRFFFHRPSR